MDGTANWADFLLPEQGRSIPLPRRAAPPRNAEPYSSGNIPWPDELTMTESHDSWDWLDYLAVAGIIVAVVGLLLAIVPESRRAGVLVPVGLAMIATAAYAARRKDQTSV